MTNYTHTTAAGTTRRRAKQVIINNPAQPLFEPDPVLIYDRNNLTAPPTMQIPPPPMASVTFVMEDRVIMADGNEVFIDRGNMTINLDLDIMSKQYPSIDAQTGVIDNSKNRHGATIVSMIMDALEDVFITEGMARDNPQSV